MKVQWNKVTWYSKIIAVILFIGLPFVGFWYGTKYGELISLSSTPASPAAGTAAGTSNYYSDVAEWQTDSNFASSFSIAYPIDFSTEDNFSLTPTTDWRLDADNVSGIKYFTLTIPMAFEPQTNFVGATLTVGASASQAGIADCLMPDQGGGAATATSSVMIHGIQFTVFKFEDAAAGSVYYTTSYRTVQSGKCYAIEYTIHAAQIANYPSQYNLKPFDDSQADAVLDRIVGTVQIP